MRKLVLTCDSCGQRMQVPRSAIGRTGMCPSCGATIKIRAHNTTTTSPAKRGGMLSGGGNWWRGSGTQPTEDAKRKFGEAVDLFYGGRYAESLAIFDALVQQFPGNPDIENGRQQCLQALRKPQQTFALEDNTGRPNVGGGNSAFSGISAGREGRLDKETVRRIVIEKMLRSPNEAVQLQAADLAARLLGMIEAEEEDKDEEKKEESVAAEIEDDVADESEFPEDEVDDADEDIRSSNVVDL